MKKCDFLDYLWLVRYRILVRLGHDPLLKKGKRHRLSRVGLRKVERDGEKANCQIAEAISSGNPFFVARLGYTEARTFGVFRQFQLGLLPEFPEESRKMAVDLSGIFTNDDAGIEVFIDCLLDGLSKVTHLCVFSTEYEPLLIKHYAKKARLLEYVALEHYFFQGSWMKELRGKKVLVVGMFADTVLKQYEKRESLFPGNPDANPIFEKLSVVKTEVTYAKDKPKYKDWKTTLEHMYQECMAMDFDVAIISAGSYGLPLGGMLFSQGKSVIHAGGVGQLYFGIYGNRYTGERYRQLINENWVRPGENERPVDYQAIEGGTYW